MDVISQEELITYDFPVQEATREYLNLLNSKRRKPATSKENSQYQPSLPKAYNVAITEQSINKALKQVYFKSRHNGNVSVFGGGSSVKSDVTCHKCGKKTYQEIL